MQTLFQLFICSVQIENINALNMFAGVWNRAGWKTLLCLYFYFDKVKSVVIESESLLRRQYLIGDELRKKERPWGKKLLTRLSVLSMLFVWLHSWSLKTE